MMLEKKVKRKITKIKRWGDFSFTFRKCAYSLITKWDYQRKYDICIIFV